MFVKACFIGIDSLLKYSLFGKISLLMRLVHSLHVIRTFLRFPRELELNRAICMLLTI